MNRVHPRAFSAVFLFAFGLICALVPGTVRAQDLPFAMEVHVPGVESYDPAIPRPESVIGHVVGDTHTRSHLVADYYRAVADASDRVVVSRHGATYEGRHLYHAVVTSPANQARLEEIRMANHRLSDAPGEVSDAMIETMPVVVHMGYGVHGNEASGPEAAMLVLYHLAAGSGPAVDGLLDRAVIIMDPNYNPDGRDRFVNWVNANRGRVATRDGQDREHAEPWPGGRTNHYWFDLNRDWLVAQHPSSKGRVGLFHHWRAQVLTDVHEMGSNATYFFQPGIPSRNNPNTPERTFELTAALAEHHAEWLDRHGALYYSRETFDDFFYGKGSTFPDVNGAIGILFEQASSRALERMTNDGVLTFPFTIRNQVATSMSTLAGSLALRTELLTHQRDFYASAPEAARRNPVKAYVLDLGGTRTRTQALLQMLLRHRIRVYELARTVQADRTLPAGRTAGSGERTFRAGEAVIIPMDQPQTRLIKASMEQVTTFTDSLFYDVSAWTLPLAMGVPSGELRSYSDDLAGAEITEAAFDGGELIGGHGSYAYLMEWDRYFAPRALYRILDAGLRPRLARQPFSVAVGGPAAWRPGRTGRFRQHRRPGHHGKNLRPGYDHHPRRPARRRVHRDRRAGAGVDRPGRGGRPRHRPRHEHGPDALGRRPGRPHLPGTGQTGDRAALGSRHPGLRGRRDLAPAERAVRHSRLPGRRRRVLGPGPGPLHDPGHGHGQLRPGYGRREPAHGMGAGGRRPHRLEERRPVAHRPGTDRRRPEIRPARYRRDPL